MSSAARSDTSGCTFTLHTPIWDQQAASCPCRLLEDRGSHSSAILCSREMHKDISGEQLWNDVLLPMAIFKDLGEHFKENRASRLCIA